MGESFLEKLVWSIADLHSDEAKKLVKEAIAEGTPAGLIITEGLMKGSEIIGERYEKKEYFLPELVMAGEIMKGIMEILRPRLVVEKTRTKGRVVIGTVHGDLHDIGKNLVTSALIGAGFEVYDLGTDVPAKKFIEKVDEVRADILAMSALLTITMPYMKAVIDELKRAGLRDKVKVIIGGRPVTEEFARAIGADAYGKDAFEAI
ncbi:MAG: B12-binding domain-containing protein, partial [Candidatus Bathyarchaeia archaeon]